MAWKPGPSTSDHFGHRGFEKVSNNVQIPQTKNDLKRYNTPVDILFSTKPFQCMSLLRLSVAQASTSDGVDS